MVKITFSTLTLGFFAIVFKLPKLLIIIIYHDSEDAFALENVIPPFNLFSNYCIHHVFFTSTLIFTIQFLTCRS